MRSGLSRRQFLGMGALLPFLHFEDLSTAFRKRFAIRDVQVMLLQGSRTYTLVKVTADDRFFGIGEAYGSPGVASTIREYVALETRTGRGDWMDEVLILDGPYIENGFIRVTEKPGLRIELNADVVRAQLAEGEAWWG